MANSDSFASQKASIHQRLEKVYSALSAMLKDYTKNPTLNTVELEQIFDINSEALTDIVTLKPSSDERFEAATLVTRQNWLDVVLALLLRKEVL